MSAPIALGNFSHAAQQAARVGGVLDVTRDNALVVRGSTWLGRRVLQVKKNLFPGDVRQQNQKILDALNVTLRASGEEGVVLDVSQSERRFTRQVADVSRTSGILQERKEGAFLLGVRVFRRLQVENGMEFPRPDLAPKSLGLNAYMVGLQEEKSLALREKFVKLVESVVTDREFGVDGKIPGGSGRVYVTPTGELDRRFLIAAYFVIAEEAYQKSGGETLPVGAGRMDRCYGLRNQQELSWLRLKRNAVG